MAIKSDAQRRAVAKYNAANYDRIELRVRKGVKEIVQNSAQAHGLSVNEFVNDAIAEKSKRGGGRMRTYTIIGGVNGTGKSSLTGVLKTQKTDLGRIIDVDKITAQNGGSAIVGGKVALERIEECLRKGLSFTQETTLSGRRTEATAAAAKEKGYTVRLYYVGLDSAEECLQRIENRVAHGGHSIREEDVLRRFAGRWEAVAKVLPYCDEARFFDNYNGFAEVAEYVNGELIVKGSNLPAWVEELRAFLA